MTVRGSYPFRVTRNSDLFLDEEEIKNLRTALAGELPQRHFGDSVRLEVADNMPAELEQFLLEQFQLTAADLYRVDGPVNLVRLMQVPDLVDIPALKFAAFVPGVPKQLEASPDLFRVIRKGDVLLHHPFQSFDPVIDFLEQSVDDPTVVAIKQTVYRTGTDSVLMKYLIDAAQRGKEVTVVVELLARFDEEANLNWAAKLEEVGAHVVYGVVGYKTHAKMSLVVRREEGRLRRYAHVSTGNLSSAHREALHGFRIADGGREDLRGRQRGFQATHRARTRTPACTISGSRRSRSTSACSRRSSGKPTTPAPQGPGTSSRR